MRRIRGAEVADVHPIIMPWPGSWDSGIVHPESSASPAPPTPAVSDGSGAGRPSCPPERVSSRMRDSSASYLAIEARACSSVRRPRPTRLRT